LSNDHIARGRALKYEAARAADPSERARLFAAAAEAYAAAGERSTYALINAATLYRMAGNVDAGRDAAVAVLGLIAAGDHEPDTPYWLAATRAEALLVLGDVPAAERALGEAVLLAPRAWEEHAITLRQFHLLVNETDESGGWLDRFRPPPVLVFGGVMGLAPDDEAAQAAVSAAVAAVAPCEAYGALAAGADILMAEAALAHEAELHVVLPDAPEAFRLASVEGVDAGWGPRFDACRDWAGTVEVLAPGGSAASAAFAAEIAMGRAIARAQALETEAIGLLVTAGEGRDRAVAALWERWDACGLPLRRIEVARSRAGPDSQRDGTAPIALLACDGDTPVVREFASLAEALSHAATRVPGRCGIDYRLVAEGETRPHALAAALMGAAREDGIRASAHAAEAARLVDPAITGELAGAVHYEGGMADFHRLHLPAKG
jgi:hypothetical protein